MREPREWALATEESVTPTGRYGESFGGYGVMGLPFRSGHVLALRRFPASSLGPYTSVWHRDPAGRWSFRQDAPDDLACPRYFGAALAATERADITLRWTGPRTLEVAGEQLRWQIEMTSTPVTRFMNLVAGVLPPRAWGSPVVLGAMERVAGVMMGVGRVGLQGRVPNGQRFQAHPLRVWMVRASTAVVDGEDLGVPGPLDEQAHLADFRIPQRGVFAVGRSFFESFDASRHVPAGGTAGS